MKKVWGIIIGLSMSGAVHAGQAYNKPESLQVEPTQEWDHIIEVSKQLFKDKEIQQAGNEAVAAFQKLLCLSVKKITTKVSPSEKEKIVSLVQLLNRMIDVYGNTGPDGITIDDEAAEELRQLGQELMILLMPLVMLTQDSVFVEKQMQLLQDTRFKLYNGVKRTMNKLVAQVESYE